MTHVLFSVWCLKPPPSVRLSSDVDELKSSSSFFTLDVYMKRIRPAGRVQKAPPLVSREKELTSGVLEQTASTHHSVGL